MCVHARVEIRPAYLLFFFRERSAYLYSLRVQGIKYDTFGGYCSTRLLQRFLSFFTAITLEFLVNKIKEKVVVTDTQKDILYNV